MFSSPINVLQICIRQQDFEVNNVCAAYLKFVLMPSVAVDV